MKTRSSLGWVLLAAMLIALCAVQQPRLVSLRERDGLSAGEAAEDMPPLVAFTTIILGGFRGLLSDALWLRATQLQDEGRTFELVQMAEWITKLEPRSSGTWSFHAWNMAYNVSTMMADPAERWQWVQNGIRLLRDEALRYNPHDARLHFELGWLFQHKIGARFDSSYLYYQQRLAAEMNAVLPGGLLAAVDLAPGAAATVALRARFGLDAERMRVFDGRYGPLDWRLPETQAGYWAFLGLQAGRDPHDLYCERMLYQALAVSFFSGRLDVDPATGHYARTPEPALLPRVIAAFGQALDGPHAAQAREAYRHFLQGAADAMQQAGQPEEAAALNARLRALPPPPKDGATRIRPQSNASNISCPA